MVGECLVQSEHDACRPTAAPRASSRFGAATRPLRLGVDNEKHSSQQSLSCGRFVVRTEMHSRDGAQASAKPYSPQAPGQCAACTPHPSTPANDGAQWQVAGLGSSGTNRYAFSPVGSSVASHSRPVLVAYHRACACK